MDLISNLAIGFDVVFTPINLLYCFVGVAIGTAIGVLPGIGPTATIAMLLPITFSLSPTASLIMLAGIYYGAQYGGSTTAILLSLPGESASVITAIDGYQMARRGRAGAALAAAAIGSFVAGCIATVLIAVFALPLTWLALEFGPAEYFSLMVLGLVSSIVLASGSLLKAVAMILLGLLLGLVGTDLYSGASRFTLDFLELADGLDFVAVAVGIFGVAEILRNLEGAEERATFVAKVSGLLPTSEDLKRIVGPILRGTAVGSILGIFPGGGALLSSFAAYTLEKKVSRNASEFGHGAIEGVAAPESANNAGSQTSFIPMLTLGIPSNPVMAMMIGALMIQGIAPGPNVAADRPDLFWGIIVSMWIGNVMLLVLNLPLLGVWVRLLSIPYKILIPAIIAFCCIGVYSIETNTFGLYEITFFGLLGYGLAKLGCEPAPLVLGFILGPMVEDHMRRALILSRGDPSIFVTQPISLGLLLAALLALVIICLPNIARKREEVFIEED